MVGVLKVSLVGLRLSYEPRPRTCKPFPTMEMVKKVSSLIALNTQKELGYLRISWKQKMAVSPPSPTDVREIIKILGFTNPGETITVDNHKQASIMQLVHANVHQALREIESYLSFTPCSGRENPDFELIKEIIRALNCEPKKSFESVRIIIASHLVGE